MKYRYLESVRKDVLEALSKDKMALIDAYLKILIRLSKDLKINALYFWIKQIEEIDKTELPITKNGIKEAVRCFEKVVLTPSTIANILCDTAEMLFTFWMEDDLCEMQGQFHYYYDKELNKIFAESTFGEIKLIEKTAFSSNFRIATISDIKLSGLFSGLEIEHYLLE